MFRYFSTPQTHTSTHTHTQSGTAQRTSTHAEDDPPIAQRVDQRCGLDVAGTAAPPCQVGLLQLQDAPKIVGRALILAYRGWS